MDANARQSRPGNTVNHSRSLAFIGGLTMQKKQKLELTWIGKENPPSQSLRRGEPASTFD